MVFGFSRRVVIGDLCENGISGSHESRNYIVLRLREDGKGETIMRQFLGCFVGKKSRSGEAFITQNSSLCLH